MRAWVRFHAAAARVRLRSSGRGAAEARRRQPLLRLQATALHRTVTLYRYTAPSHRTVTSHRHAAPLQFTVTPRRTVTSHRHTAPVHRTGTPHRPRHTERTLLHACSGGRPGGGWAAYGAGYGRRWVGAMRGMGGIGYGPHGFDEMDDDAMTTCRFVDWNGPRRCPPRCAEATS